MTLHAREERGNYSPVVGLTIDVEQRRNSPDLAGVESDVSTILEFLRSVCRATFFVTGEIAARMPDVVRAIANEGHEVGCHGLYHERLDTLTPNDQLGRISLATHHLTRAMRKRPLGFRAPEHRANTATILALEQLNYVYDSSVLSGTPFMHPQAHKKWRFIFAPQEPYYPSRIQLTRRGDCGVMELPCSSFIFPFVSKLSMRSTFASDTLSAMLVRRAKSKGTPIIYCMHSYDCTFKNGELSWLERLTSSLRRHGVRVLRMIELSNSYRKEQETRASGGV